MKKIVFSAPGSLILSGEYGMLFGKPVLILAIDQRVQVTLIETKKRNIDKKPYIKEAETIVKEYLQENNISYKEGIYKIVIEADLPEAESFGYSSALYCAVIASLLALYSQKAYSRETINILSYQLEKKFNKKSYGIRTSASVFGGLLYFRKEFEFLRTISLLHLKIPQRIEKHLFILKNMSLSESTEEIENTIGSEYNMNGSLTEQLLIELEKVTKRIVVSLFKEDDILFKESMAKQEELEKKLYPRDRLGAIIYREDSFRDLYYMPYRQALSGITAL